jgi:hypothetical protein
VICHPLWSPRERREQNQLNPKRGFIMPGFLNFANILANFLVPHF